MAEYRDKFDEWQNAAKERVRELDEKYGIRERVEHSARKAQEAAKKSAQSVAESAEKARIEAEKLASDLEMKERAKQAGKEAARHARRAGEAFKGAADTASEKAGKAFDSAKDYFDRAAQFSSFGAGAARASLAATGGLVKARDWILRNPGKAGLTCFSIIVGVRMGASFPGIDAVLLGSHPHWLTHSALPVWGARKAAEKFEEYLKKNERLIQEGDLTGAERERAEFERKIVTYVGAPLLGAFSCAAGAAMWAQIVQPGAITGAPISWLLGGNPFLDGLWLFGNDLICFHQGYKFFMMALADQKDVARVVREIRGLLPAEGA